MLWKHHDTHTHIYVHNTYKGIPIQQAQAKVGENDRSSGGGDGGGGGGQLRGNIVDGSMQPLLPHPVMPHEHVCRHARTHTLSHTNSFSFALSISFSLDTFLTRFLCHSFSLSLVISVSRPCVRALSLRPTHVFVLDLTYRNVCTNKYMRACVLTMCACVCVCVCEHTHMCIFACVRVYCVIWVSACMHTTISYMADSTSCMPTGPRSCVIAFSVGWCRSCRRRRRRKRKGKRKGRRRRKQCCICGISSAAPNSKRQEDCPSNRKRKETGRGGVQIQRASSCSCRGTTAAGVWYVVRSVILRASNLRSCPLHEYVVYYVWGFVCAYVYVCVRMCVCTYEPVYMGAGCVRVHLCACTSNVKAGAATTQWVSQEAAAGAAAARAGGAAGEGVAGAATAAAAAWGAREATKAAWSTGRIVLWRAGAQGIHVWYDSY